MAPSIACSNNAFVSFSVPVNRCNQASYSPWLRVPAASQASRMFAGTSKGAWLQPRAAFDAAASSLPSGDPCELDVPCFLGEP